MKIVIKELTEYEVAFIRRTGILNHKTIQKEVGYLLDVQKVPNLFN
ncbi:hypothetical protein QUF73_13785 [Cytobacillus sp. NJ13]|nr:hypothetical protein [Cytobacillus sp. NJ13]